MYLYSKLPKDRYLAAMRRKFTNPLLIFDERVTGFVLGPFFSVAHYQPYEWNRRITSECNRAWGVVRETHGELEISFFRGTGYLAPGWVMVYTLLVRAIFLISELRYGMELDMTAWVLSLGVALIVCAATAVSTSMTEAGQQGAWEITKFLTDPENYH